MKGFSHLVKKKKGEGRSDVAKGGEEGRKVLSILGGGKNFEKGGGGERNGKTGRLP